MLILTKQAQTTQESGPPGQLHFAPVWRRHYLTMQVCCCFGCGKQRVGRCQWGPHLACWHRRGGGKSGACRILTQLLRCTAKSGRQGCAGKTGTSAHASALQVLPCFDTCAVTRGLGQNVEDGESGWGVRVAEAFSSMANVLSRGEPAKPKMGSF